MDSYRCQLCSKPSLLTGAPSHCSFCGAPGRLIVPVATYEAMAVGDLDKKGRGALESVLELTVEDCRFFRAAAKVADSAEGQALFAVLARFEACHASLLCRILDRERPEELREPGDCSPAHKTNLDEARKRQERAIQRCRRALQESSGERVEQVLNAFIEIKTALLRD